MVHNLTSTRKTTSGSTTIVTGNCLLKNIVINDAGQKCIIVIKDDTTIKHMFMPEYSSTVGKPKVLNMESPIATSLKVEMTKLDPVLLFKFNNPNSTTSEDLSGSNIDGTGGNMEAGDKKEDAERGKYLEFGGTDEYVNLGDNFDMAHNLPYSVSFWVKKTTTVAGYAMAKYAAAAGWGIYYGSDDKIIFFVRDAAAGDLTVKQATALVTNTWTHITITLDGTGKAAGTAIYVNGVADTLSTTTDTLAATGANALNFLLGAKEGPATVWAGNLDEVMIFNRELSAAEAEFLFRNGYGYAAVDGCRLADITLVYEK